MARWELLVYLLVQPIGIVMGCYIGEWAVGGLVARVVGASVGCIGFAIGALTWLDWRWRRSNGIE